MTPRRAKCVVCLERPAEWGCICERCGKTCPRADWDKHTPMELFYAQTEWAARRARTFERKRQKKARRA